MKLSINEMAKIADSVSRQAGHTKPEVKINHQSKVIIVGQVRRHHVQG